MTKLIAKSIFKNKECEVFIVESDGQKVGTIQANVNGTVNLMTGTIRQSFPSIKNLNKEYDIKFDRVTKAKTERISSTDINSAFGIPTNTKPHNVLWDAKHKTAVFTENTKSKSYHCAGHYIVKLGKTWNYEFCPKLIIIDRYPYKGPFNTKEEANASKT
jgi:hypothetical protein